MIGLMVVMLTFFYREYGFTSMGVDAILGNEYGILGQNSVVLLKGSEMSAGHYRNLVLGI